MIFVTSDLHFNHGNIIELCRRPFSDIGEMNAALIDNWNSLVGEKDEVYILGDFAFAKNSAEVKVLADALKGRKYLVKGNHDEKKHCEAAFDWVRDYHVLKYEGFRFVMFHFPILDWDGYNKSNYAHLYGHVHNSPLVDEGGEDRLKILTGRRAFNVGVDVNMFRPVSLEAIIKVLSLKAPEK